MGYNTQYLIDVKVINIDNLSLKESISNLINLSSEEEIRD
jgi:hypothetical protein